MLKKIFLSCVLSLSIIASVFSETSVALKNENESILVGESFTISVEIHSDENIRSEVISFEGLESFTKLAHQSFNSIQIINGKTNSTQTVSFVLIADAKGSYSIGPAVIKVGDTEYTSDTILVVIEDDVILSVPESNDGEESESKNTDEMTDIHDIKDLNLKLSDFNLIPLYIVVFLIIFYYLLSFLISKNNQIIEGKKDKDIAIKTNNQKLLGALTMLEKNIESLSKEEFYKVLSTIFREYFMYNGQVNAHNMTLDEITKSEVNPQALELFKRAYFLEFGSKGDNSENRRYLIEKLRDFLNN